MNIDLMAIMRERHPEMVAPQHPERGLPGTELKAMLAAWLRIRSDSGCKCDEMAARMDHWGPDETERHIDEIVEHMRQEHARRHADGRTRLPWVEAGARQLVLLACKRARQNGRISTP